MATPIHNRLRNGSFIHKKFEEADKLWLKRKGLFSTMVMCYFFLLFLETSRVLLLSLVIAT